MTTGFVSGVCAWIPCSKPFTQKHRTGREPTLYCCQSHRAKAVWQRIKDGELPQPHPRSADKQPRMSPHHSGVKEKVAKCPKCNVMVTFDVDNMGYVLERCRCGVRFIGAVS